MFSTFTECAYQWQFGLVVTSLDASKKLPYIELGQY